MSITKFISIKCDVEGCSNQTPLLDFDPSNRPVDEAHDEEIRVTTNYSYLDIPFGLKGYAYICEPCVKKMLGESAG